MEMQAMFGEWTLPLGHDVRLLFPDRDLMAVVWSIRPLSPEELSVIFLYHPTDRVLLPKP